MRSSSYKIGEKNIISPDFYLSHKRIDDCEKGDHEDDFVSTSYNFSLVKEAWEHANTCLVNWCTQRAEPKVIFLCGIPGSGKTTWLRNTELFPHPINSFLSETVFFDATFTNLMGRQKTIKMIMENNPNTLIGMIQFNTPYEVCIERNNKRTEDRQIPTPVMERMRNALIESPPSIEEGFRFITTVDG